MQYIFFLPEIHQMQTGGNIYNRHMMTHLMKSEKVHRVVIENPFRSDHLKEDLKYLLAERGNIFIIDSLLATNTDLLRSLDDINCSAVKYLMVHFLNILDSRDHKLPRIKHEAKYLEQFDGFITSSHYSREMLAKNGIRENDVVTVKPGILLPERLPDKTPNKPLRLLTVSSLLPGKGLIQILEILDNLTDIEWYWELVGETKIDPAYHQQFIRQVEETSFSDRILCSGAVAQEVLFEKYRRSDIFVLPSEFESCSMVTMEAMAHGLPVIAHRVGGLTELVRDAETGYLISLNNQTEFLRRLRQLMLKGELRLHLGTQAVKVAAQYYSWEAAANRLNEFIKTHSQNMIES
jgi:glycosyltransferase involved in cell wall biosynthesis